MSPPSWSWRWYPRSRPRRKEGGIKAKSRRGAFGGSWWSRRFIELLADFGMGRRLARGRSYARSGQVFDLEVDAGLVTAKVQGSRYEPYEVTIRLKPLGRVEWRRVARELSSRAVFAAKLLAGSMPREIEEAFGACNLSVFPASRQALETECTCPDWASPCKHVAATYYILAEQFDDDPFLVFRWRGCPRDRLLATMRQLRAKGRSKPARDGEAEGDGARPRTAEPEDELALLPSDPETFWGGGAALETLHYAPRAAEEPDAILHRLGPSGIEVGGVDLIERLMPVYHLVTKEAEQLALGGGSEADPG
jgi:uncharacterized Zn finger protein